MDSDTDADLARAIALSMEDAERATGKAHLSLPATTTKPKSTKTTAKTKAAEKRSQNGGKPEVFVISSDEEEDLVPKPRAVKAKPKSKATSTNANLKSTQPVEDLEKEASMPPAPTPPAAGAGAGPLSLLVDRAQMERERLARAKRVRGPSPPPPPRSRSPGSSDYEEEDGDANNEDAESGSEGSARKRARLDKGGGKADTLGGGAGKDVAGKDKGKGKDSSANGGRRTFPDGALLRVDTQHADASIPTSTPCIRLSELLGPRTELAFAVLSAFVVDASWLYGFFEPETPVVLVGDAGTSGGGGEGAYAPTLKNIFPNWVRVCPPLPLANNGRGCMHMKFMLLFGKDGGLRVVVGSANLVPHDWRDVENYFFVQNLPPVSPAAGSTVRRRPAEREKPGRSFPALLARTLRAVGMEEALGYLRRRGVNTLQSFPCTPFITFCPSLVFFRFPSTSFSSLPSYSHNAPLLLFPHLPSSSLPALALTNDPLLPAHLPPPSHPPPLRPHKVTVKVTQTRRARNKLGCVRAALVPSVPGRWEGWAGEGAVVWCVRCVIFLFFCCCCWRGMMDGGGVDARVGIRRTGVFALQMAPGVGAKSACCSSR